MGTMDDLSRLEAVIRRIAREEITRALGAAGAVADGAQSTDPYDTDDVRDTALDAMSSVMERVARDVLADSHPALNPEHTASTAACTCSCRACFGCTMDEHTASTEPVHTITAVPERPRATCTCHRHTHVMGHDDRCGAPFCYCLSPVRARTPVADTHAGHTILGGRCVTCSETPRTCPTCKHGVHEAGKCAMHVYLRGVASPCPCLEWVRPEAVVSTRPNLMCTVCEHAPHGAGECEQTIPYGEAAFQCTCGGQAEPVACPTCAHTEHVGMYCPECRCKGGLR